MRVTDVPGLYFVGLPWQHTRGSALLGFVNNDAAFLAGRIAVHQHIQHADAWHGPAPANAVANGGSYRDRGT